MVRSEEIIFDDLNPNEEEILKEAIFIVNKINGENGFDVGRLYRIYKVKRMRVKNKLTYKQVIGYLGSLCKKEYLSSNDGECYYDLCLGHKTLDKLNI